MNLVKMTLLSMSYRSSVDRAPARCSGGHGFDSCRGLQFFFVPRSCSVDELTLHVYYRAQNSPSLFTYYKNIFAVLLGWCGYFHDIHHWPTDCVRGHRADLQ